MGSLSGKVAVVTGGGSGIGLATATRLAEGLTVDWIAGAARALVQVEQGMRRNLLRSLSLDAMVVSMAVGPR